jgi:DNA polymerase
MRQPVSWNNTEPPTGNGSYDCGKVGLWEYWQGNTLSPIALIGQDWGDIGYYMKWHGREGPSNTTNNNIVKLFDSIGICIDPSGTKRSSNRELFFTNAILCLKTKGGLQGGNLDQWYANCVKEFLKPMMERIVKPKVLIILGRKASIEISKFSSSPVDEDLSMHEISRKNFDVFGAQAYPVYHPGAWGIWNRYNDESKFNPDYDLEYSRENGLALHVKDWGRFKDISLNAFRGT